MPSKTSLYKMICEIFDDQESVDPNFDSTITNDSILNNQYSSLSPEESDEDNLQLTLSSAELLDSKLAKDKAKLVSKGSLANRQPPSIKRQTSGSSVEGSSESASPRESNEPLMSSKQSNVVSKPPASIKNEEKLLPTYSSIYGSQVSSQALKTSEQRAINMQELSHPIRRTRQVLPNNPEKSKELKIEPNFIKKKVVDWNLGDVSEWLASHEMEKYTAIFRTNRINGLQLLQLDFDRLKV